MSPKYGFETESFRLRLVEELLKEKCFEIVKQNILNDIDVIMFIDYGIINKKTDKLFFEWIIKHFN